MLVKMEDKMKKPLSQILFVISFTEINMDGTESRPIFNLTVRINSRDLINYALNNLWVISGYLPGNHDFNK